MRKLSSAKYLGPPTSAIRVDGLRIHVMASSPKPEETTITSKVEVFWTPLDTASKPVGPSQILLADASDSATILAHAGSPSLIDFLESLLLASIETQTKNQRIPPTQMGVDLRRPTFPRPTTSETPATPATPMTPATPAPETILGAVLATEPGPHPSPPEPPTSPATPAALAAADPATTHPPPPPASDVPTPAP